MSDLIFSCHFQSFVYHFSFLSHHRKYESGGLNLNAGHFAQLSKDVWFSSDWANCVDELVSL